MKNALKIYKRDLKKIFKNSMAIILVVGLAVLPSLYAWFNIYANWDPYGSTGNMMVAVVNEDEGYTYRDIEINIGNNITQNLKANDAIDWQFVSREKALSGIEAGEYYAGIEIPARFSESFASIMTPEFVQPKITYYANEKKNAIATKITDKVVQTVQTQVNESFVTTVIDLVNAMLGVVVEKGDIEASGAITSIQDQIKVAQDGLNATNATLDSFNEVLALSNELADSMDPKKITNLLDNTSNMLDDAEEIINVAKSATSAVVSNVGVGIETASTSLEKIADVVREDGGSKAEDAKKRLQEATKSLSNVKTTLDKAYDIIITLNNALPQPLEKANKVAAEVKAVSDSMDKIINDINGLDTSSSTAKAKEIAKRLDLQAENLRDIKANYIKNVQPKLESSVGTVLGELNSLSNIVDSLSDNAPKMGTLMDALDKSVGAGDTMVGTLSTLIDSASGQLKSLSDKLEALKDSEILNTMMNLTKGNASELGAFLACPVEIKTEKVYGIENYGSAMAPFYSTLAIWVGGMFLVAVMTTSVKKKKEIGNVKMHEAYFGRGLTFLSISLVQGLIICLGDLLIFKIQCYHPVQFVLAGCFASLVFTLFIYSLTYALGDIGKTIGVIMLVLQIGGSGGTFPIDVCPPLFRAINPYLPFTFVIQAMRETICGLYENDYWMYMLKLCAYIAIALVIGLGLKIIVHKPLKFFEKGLEKTDLL